MSYISLYQYIIPDCVFQNPLIFRTQVKSLEYSTLSSSSSTKTVFKGILINFNGLKKYYFVARFLSNTTTLVRSVAFAKKCSLYFANCKEQVNLLARLRETRVCHISLKKIFLKVLESVSFFLGAKKCLH
jgi:hypothetical protein